MKSGDIDAFVIRRWQLEHAVPSIRLQLLMLGHGLNDKSILAIVRSYIDDASENTKINSDKLWMMRLRRALRRLR